MTSTCLHQQLLADSDLDELQLCDAGWSAAQVGYVVAWGSPIRVRLLLVTDVSANTQLAYGTTMALGQLSTCKRRWRRATV